MFLRLASNSTLYPPSPGDKLKGVKIILPEALEALVREKVRSGRYVDESDVMRDALRALEWRDDGDSTALEAALLEGVRSPHRPYGRSTLDRIRKAARRK